MEKINEGFWDAVLAQAKRAGLSAAATLGSNKADGQLKAANLGMDIYNAYKNFVGASGAVQNAENMKDFLVRSIGFSDDFSTRAAIDFQQMVNGEPKERSEPQSQPQQAQPTESVIGRTSLDEDLSDKELRNFFDRLAKSSILNGQTKYAAGKEIKGINSNNRQSIAPNLAPSSSTPSDSTNSGTVNNTPTASTPSTSSGSNTSGATPPEVKVAFNNANFSQQEIDLLNQVQNQVGLSNIVQTKGNDPEVTKLAQRIINKALFDFNKAKGNKTQKISSSFDNKNDAINEDDGGAGGATAGATSSANIASFTQAFGAEQPKKKKKKPLVIKRK